jgi:hypothetical protein
MAITTTSISINPGWASSTLVNQLEAAFTWLGLHGGADSGLVIGVSTYTANVGGTVGTIGDDYFDVETTSLTGIGTGLTLDIFRTSGVIDNILVNRPGYGYTGGEIVRVSAANIGGASNGASNFDVIVSIAATVTGSASYACTFSSISGSSFIINGLDRNGTVGGANTTITIREGDYLTITNSYGYQIAIGRTSSGGYLYAPQTIPFNSTSNVTSGQTMVFSPAVGQAGTYHIDDGYSNLNGGTIVVLPANSADINSSGFGSTSGFYFKRLTGSGHNSAAVLKQVIDPNKKFGTTYRGFMLYDSGNGRYDWLFNVGSGFHPYMSNIGNFNFGGMAKTLRWVGSPGHDTPYRPTQNDDNNSLASSTQYAQIARAGSQNGENERLSTGSNTGYKLDLNIFRSQLDPNFAVLSYRNSTLSSQRISDNTFGTFILHNFTSNIWDLNNVFLSGYTQIIPSTSGSTTIRPNIVFRTYVSGNMDRQSSVYPSRRAAEFGYSNIDAWSQFTQPYVDDVYVSNAYLNADNFNYTASATSKRIYYRSASQAPERGYGGFNNQRQLTSNADFNAVIKGIPLNGQLVPVPYYLPDDFVLIDFSYNLPGVNIQQGDTITVSPSEVYTVINGSYSQKTKTAGILFCARTI